MIWAWLGFLAFVGALLALDLGVFNKKAHTPSMKEALLFTGGVMVLAIMFTALVWVGYHNHWLGLGNHLDAVDGRVNDGRLAAVKFLTGYVIELSLSMDNVFVIALIFQHLRIPTHLQHRVLFWGILGALAMRGAMIGVGAALVARYHWVLYLFGAFLVYTGIRMLLTTGEEDAPGETWVMRKLRKTFPITEAFHGSHFTVKQNGRLWLTPLAVALVLVETTDLIFAVDSIPAIFAITADPFLVFTSNVFAILCLRSLYFGLAGLIERFKYLKVSLSVILALVGVKMLTSKWLVQWFGESLNFWMLGLVAGILLVGAVASGRDDKPPRASAT
ncbi:MAG: TerC family protein [Gemmatimonadaceae bacterium]